MVPHVASVTLCWLKMSLEDSFATQQLTVGNDDCSLLLKGDDRCCLSVFDRDWSAFDLQDVLPTSGRCICARLQPPNRPHFFFFSWTKSGKMGYAVKIEFKTGGMLNGSACSTQALEARWRSSSWAKTSAAFFLRQTFSMLRLETTEPTTADNVACMFTHERKILHQVKKMTLSRQTTHKQLCKWQWKCNEVTEGQQPATNWCSCF